MPHKDPEARRAYWHEYHLTHAKERIAGNKRRRAANPEKARSAERKRYAENKEERCAYNRQYYADNTDKICQRERELYAEKGEHIRAYNRAWMKAHPLVGMRGKIRRRLREKAAYIEDVSLDVIYKRDKGLCSLCHKKVAHDTASIDHIIPLALGGEHSYRNTALAHLTCNIRKQHRVATQQMRLF